MSCLYAYTTNVMYTNNISVVNDTRVTGMLEWKENNTSYSTVYVLVESSPDLQSKAKGI